MALAAQLLATRRDRDGYAESRALHDLRRRALDAQRERYQQLSPFKFIFYSGQASADPKPVA